ncbi:MAG TPA: hypothetical protein VF808_02350 [Ktedonobacterales bacterium]
MREASLRRALVSAIIAAVVGVVALALGAFIAPIPIKTSATQVVTALFVRSILAILALGLSLYLAYRTGGHIDSDAPNEPSTPQADPSASSAILSLVTTPGSRRDALFAGGIITGAYWIMTTLYIIALGKIVGNVGVGAGDIGSYLGSHVWWGLALVVVGMGFGALGARAAYARRVTSKSLSIPAIPPAPLSQYPTTPVDPPAPQE